jgi:hypothetical protein
MATTRATKNSPRVTFLYSALKAPRQSQIGTCCATRSVPNISSFLFLCVCLVFLRAACLAAALAKANPGYDKSAPATASVRNGSPSVISKTAQTPPRATSSVVECGRLGRRCGRYRHSRRGCRSVNQRPSLRRSSVHRRISPFPLSNIHALLPNARSKPTFLAAKLTFRRSP